MSAWSASITYKRAVRVDFETDEREWREIQLAAVDAALEQGLIPDDWLSIEIPIVEIPHQPSVRSKVGEGCDPQRGES